MVKVLMPDAIELTIKLFICSFRQTIRHACANLVYCEFSFSFQVSVIINQSVKLYGNSTSLGLNFEVLNRNNW